jgi:hypothetical protein
MVLFFNASASISPSCGDSRIAGHIIKQDVDDEEANRKITNGIANLIRGSTKFFIVMFGDKGQSYWS